MSSNDPPAGDPLEFMRRMWGNLGFGLPGLVTPTLDVDELERRINDLRAVEGWLKMNLSMLQMTIQGLDMQRATLHAMQHMGQAAAAGDDGKDTPNPFANPALWQWPFPTTTTEAPPPDDMPPPDTGTKPPKPGRKGKSA